MVCEPCDESRGFGDRIARQRQVFGEQRRVGEGRVVLSDVHDAAIGLHEPFEDIRREPIVGKLVDVDRRCAAIGRVPSPTIIVTMIRGAVRPITSLCAGRSPPEDPRPFAEVEFDAVALPQILEPFAVHGAPVKVVLLPGVVLDEPESLVNSQRSNRSRHHAMPFCSLSSLENRFRSASSI